jgi:hypothetical protein
MNTWEAPVMSYDLAVWEGPRPESDEAAGETFADLCERYLEADEPIPPTEPIGRYADALLARWPEITTEAAETGPWAVAPLISDAVGSIIVIPIVGEQAEEVSAFAAEVARAHGLVCFDPQLDQLRP